MLKRPLVSLTAILACVFVSFPILAKKHHDEDGHALVQDVHKPGTRIEFEEDQDEVYDAVQKGYVRPFSEMFAAVERDLNGRIIHVELEEDDDIWVYELKLNHNNNIIKVEYNAETLEMLQIKGRNIKEALKK
ncbi:PepSY domain-containing protein [Vibrio tubiashii]|uniref:PepSY domain-containing protein n=1 Tax=Vibrio tubiashii TaxID=29498 RepID=UPI00234E5615|nr:PepSY domain-containing protein [Vibrio tubiashii]WCP65866.1 PepSY domain-containing protein [Vibrio tubiashii]